MAIVRVDASLAKVEALLSEAVLQSERPSVVVAFRQRKRPASLPAARGTIPTGTTEYGRHSARAIGILDGVPMAAA
jgi:hypothetical protein